MITISETQTLSPVTDTRGLKYVINSNSHTPQWYDFGTDGKAVKLNSTGLLTVEGRIYYLVNGISQTGLQLIDGKYYYFSGTYEAKKNVVYVSSAKGNGLLPEGYYLFKEDMFQGRRRVRRLAECSSLYKKRINRALRVLS